MFPETNQPIALKEELVDLATWRKQERLSSGKMDPFIIHAAYAQDNEIYRNGHIIAVDATTYHACKTSQPNELVNKFGPVYAAGAPLLLHKLLANVIIDVAMDMHARYGQLTVIMDALRTYESGVKMQENRPDLVASGLLAPAGTSAHNRALAVDSKLFVMRDGMLVEADEHGHLDDLDMAANSRFYMGPMSDAARQNRLNRLQAWQRASVKNKLPIANLLAEFWDDRIPGSPADMWRVLCCRALCLGIDANPKSHGLIAKLRDDLNQLHDTHQANRTSRNDFAQEAYAILVAAWDAIFTKKQRQELDNILGNGGGSPPVLADFVFHEWLETIHDDALEKAWGFRQAG